MEELMLNQSYLFNYTDYDYVEFEPPCSYEKTQKVEHVLGLYVHSVICILGLVGNSLVIVTYAFYKRTKSMTDVYLLNVAVADLLFVLALPLLVYNEQTSWPMGPAACKLLRGSYSVNLYSGMLLLACISADRYVAIVQARRSFRLRSLTYSRIICAAVWASAFLLSVPSFYYYHWYEPSHLFMINETSHLFMINETSHLFMINETSRPLMINETSHPLMINETSRPLMINEMSRGPRQYICELRFEDVGTAVTAKVAVPSTQLVVGFFLPLCVMIFCYAAVIVTLLKARNFQRHKAVRVVLVVVLVFIACHLPYNVALLYDTVVMFGLHSCEEEEALQTALALMQSFAYLHCCLNPVLYAFVGVRFRNHFRRIFRDLWCLGKRYIAPRRFSRVTSEFYVSTIRRSVDGSSENGSSFTM